jgi:cell filamentation protein
VSGDPYLDPRTGVFRNRLGLTDRAELAAVEKTLSAVRADQLKHRLLAGRYDLDHPRAFHWTIFQDVYPWAGQLRTVLIVKAGASFCLPHQIVETAEGIFGRLAAEDHLRGRDRQAFLDGLSTLLADVNALHPFREGNGRTSGRSCPSSPGTPGSGCTGRRSTATPTSTPPARPPTVTSPRCAPCSTRS